jgi:hypothetical protein
VQTSFLNVRTDAFVNITDISLSSVVNFGGEADDAVRNATLVAPNSIQLGNGSNFNIKFTWEPVDVILDNDVDFGNWRVIFSLKCDRICSEFGSDTANVFANVQVFDAQVVPLPSTLSFLVSGLGMLGLLGYCQKRKLQAA